MPFTQAYHEWMAQATVGLAPTPFDAANAYIGVGNGTAAFDPSQTDLQGTSTVRRPMATGYPTLTGNQAQFQAVFAETDANFDWQEFAVFNAAAGGVMLGREVQDLGTKVAGTIWRMTVTVTWATS
ncbi:MAG: hypothetical protein IRZ08_22905 [Frankia sp.]|nr:hypothetical protein [Frankia sp.]